MNRMPGDMEHRENIWVWLIFQTSDLPALKFPLPAFQFLCATFDIDFVWHKYGMFAHFCCHCCGCHFHSGYVFIISSSSFFCQSSSVRRAPYAPVAIFLICQMAQSAKWKPYLYMILRHGVVLGFVCVAVACGQKNTKKKETTAGILIILMRALLAMPAVAVAVNRYFALPIEWFTRTIERPISAGCRRVLHTHHRLISGNQWKNRKLLWHTLENLMRIIHGILPTLHFGLRLSFGCLCFWQ